MRCLLYPYNIELLEGIEDSDVVICGDHLNCSKPMIRISAGAKKDFPIDDQGNGIVDVDYQLMRQCSDKFQAVMNPRVASMYKLATQLPLRYKLIPSSVRNILLRARLVDCDLSHHTAMEILRGVLREAFGILGFHLERRNPPSLIITHDVESGKGLEKALSLKRVEDALAVRSTWFLPSEEYPIPCKVAKELSKDSTIGSHDIRHDGRLIHIRKSEELVERLSSSRLKLEKIFEKEVECFRSPLLQFNKRIAGALGKSGYRFDFSIPCWEPANPVTMSGFGIESVQPFDIDGVTEFPLTLFQDHQVLNVLGMDTHEAIRLWIQQAKLIRMFGGDIVLLIHPDYAFSQHLEDYRELLTKLLKIHSSTEHQISPSGGQAYYA